MSFKLNPNLHAELTRNLTQHLDVAAKEAADTYAKNISRGPRSGIHHPNLPARSSAPDEFLQEQSGAHHDSVTARTTSNPLLKEFGAFNVPDTPDAALAALEFGSADGRIAGRFSLTRTAESAETHARMQAAIEGDAA